MSRARTALLVALALSSLVACSDGSASTAPTSGSVEATDFNAADVSFAEGMVPHHLQAIEMADLALDGRAVDPFILELAAAVKAAQGPEVDQLDALLVAWGEPRVEGGEPAGHAMHGMLSPDQLAELVALSGTEFDRRWAELMIQHHEGAVAMAADVLADGENPALAKLAEAVIAAQNEEIVRMREFLEQ